MIFDQYTPREYAHILTISHIDQLLKSDWSWANGQTSLGKWVEMTPREADRVRAQLTKLRETLRNKVPTLDI